MKKGDILDWSDSLHLDGDFIFCDSARSVYKGVEVGYEMTLHRSYRGDYPPDHKLPDEEEYYFIEGDSRKFSSEQELIDAIDLISERGIRDNEI